MIEVKFVQCRSLCPPWARSCPRILRSTGQQSEFLRLLSETIKTTNSAPERTYPTRQSVVPGERQDLSVDGLKITINGLIDEIPNQVRDDRCF